ncbi:MAG: hypothetical protein WHT81_00575 [Rectinemataceae bacterium]|nr:hypothetical protein [Spirochaetaceae bacterium]
MPDRFRYSAFGMSILSDFPLPLLPPMDEATNTSDWLVEIRWGSVPKLTENAISLFQVGRIQYEIQGIRVLVEIPDSARYAIEGDNLILVDPCGTQLQSTMIGFYITGLMLIFLLKARGLLVLHGSAVATDGGAILFIGNRGSGKSTTAAALARNGNNILCDDVIPIEENARVLRGIPRPRLLPDAYETLIGDPTMAAASFDGVDKYQVQMPAGILSAPLRHICILEQENREDIHLQALRGAEKFRAVMTHSVFFKGIDTAEKQFSLCSSILSRVGVTRVIRPSDRDTLDILVQKINERIIKGVQIC